MTIDLSIVIVSYNTRELTLACVESVFAQTRNAFEVIVLDNASTDGSPDAIAEKFPQVQLIRSAENVGFARGNNLAARHAGGRYLLLLNPDTVVLDRAIDKLLTFADAHGDAQIFGGRALFADGSLNPASCWRRATPWSAACIALGLTSLFPQSNMFARESYGSWARDTVREVDIVSGCFFLIRRHVWEELRGFDPAFFMYGEEADLCLRARKQHHRCLICPTATIIHHGGASERVRADKMVRLFNAKARLIRRHWRAPWVPFGLGALGVWALTRLAAWRVLAVLRADRRDGYLTWRKIWMRRDEYLADPPFQAVSAPSLP
jgi:N-acetylglucosaminyl-diphospho-decaprenol L-rhamnosyltransferase